MMSLQTHSRRFQLDALYWKLQNTEVDTNTSIITAHKANLSVLSAGPGAPLFLLLSGPTGLSGAFPTLSPSLLLHSSCAAHNLADDLEKGGKVTWNCFISVNRWLRAGNGHSVGHGHYFSGDYVSIVISVLLLCHCLAGNVFGLITLQMQDKTDEALLNSDRWHTHAHNLIYTTNLNYTIDHFGKRDQRWSRRTSCLNF